METGAVFRLLTVPWQLPESCILHPAPSSPCPSLLVCHTMASMSCCHVHSPDGRYILKSSRVCHMQSLHCMQTHAYVPLFGTSRFPDLKYCIFASLPLPEPHLDTLLPQKFPRLLPAVYLDHPSFLSAVSSRVFSVFIDFLF